jgi:hypothetical protein
MKTSNSILCAVIVFVLGLSAAVSPPQALAAVETVHPATMCVKSAGGANIARASGGTITNSSPTQNLFVQCDVVNDVDLNVAGNHPVILGGVISTTDRHPSLGIHCSLFQAVRTFQTSNVIFRFINNFTNGAAENLKFLSYGPPDPTGITGFRSNNFFLCFIPPTSNGNTSEIHFYSVEEEF